MFPLFDFFELLSMYSLEVRSASVRAHGSIHSARMSNRLFGEAPSTPCRWNSLRHRNRDSSRCLSREIRKLTDSIIHFINSNLHASSFLNWDMLKSHIPQVFDLSVSRQTVFEAILRPRIDNQKNRRHT